MQQKNKIFENIEKSFVEDLGGGEHRENTEKVMRGAAAGYFSVFGRYSSPPQPKVSTNEFQYFSSI